LSFNLIFLPSFHTCRQFLGPFTMSMMLQCRMSVKLPFVFKINGSSTVRKVDFQNVYRKSSDGINLTTQLQFKSATPWVVRSISVGQKNCSARTVCKKMVKKEAEKKMKVRDQNKVQSAYQHSCHSAKLHCDKSLHPQTFSCTALCLQETFHSSTNLSCTRLEHPNQVTVYRVQGLDSNRNPSTIIAAPFLGLHLTHLFQPPSLHSIKYANLLIVFKIKYFSPI